MCKMIDQYADKIKRQLSFFDRMIINGYLRPLLSEQTRIGYLYSMGIPLRDFTEYFKDVTDRLLKQIEDSAGELGRPIVYLPSSKITSRNLQPDGIDSHDAHLPGASDLQRNSVLPQMDGRCFP